ncbi:MAG: 8-amino-7-oxononanoate synthase [Dokdonella sp.]
MTRPDPIARLAAARAQRASEGLLRRLRISEESSAGMIASDGRRLVNFASNDYLGLAHDARVVEALRDGARRYGVGAGAAHLLGGHHQAHAELEHEIARWTGRERALLFSTGYMANLGVVSALLGDGDRCVQDKLNHASLIDAARLAGCELRRYRHADVEGARQQLDALDSSALLLATDGVFSMDGDIAPLVELAEMAKSSSATLMVDDAHGIGVLGASGAGSLESAHVSANDAPILMATFGKALGTFGAFVAGSTQLIDGLVQFARSHVYTTALPPALAAATRVAVSIVRDDHERRAKLHHNIATFRAAAEAHRLNVKPSSTPIQPLSVGSSKAATQLSRQLESAGYFVPAIRPPTVPDGAARLRITLSAAHGDEQIDGLIGALAAALGGSAA